MCLNLTNFENRRSLVFNSPDRSGYPATRDGNAVV